MSSEDMEEEITVVQIRNPEALALPPILDLFDRALSSPHFPDVKEVTIWCAVGIMRDTVGVFVARDAEKWIGLCIFDTTTSVWCDRPTFLHGYSEKKDGLRALTRATVEWMRGRGIDQFDCINVSGIPDEAYLGILGSDMSGAVIGSVIRYDVQDVIDEESSE